MMWRGYQVRALSLRNYDAAFKQYGPQLIDQLMSRVRNHRSIRSRYGHRRPPAVPFRRWISSTTRARHSS